MWQKKIIKVLLTLVLAALTVVLLTTTAC